MADILRTSPERFAALPGFPWRGHSRDDFPGFRPAIPISTKVRPAPVFLCLHGQPTWSYLYRRMIPHFLATGSRGSRPTFLVSAAPTSRPTTAIYTFDFHRNSLLAFVRTLDLTDVTLVVQDWGGLLGRRCLWTCLSDSRA